MESNFLQYKKIKYEVLIVVSIIAVCGIVYELLISTAASYLLGDSIKQFSIIIGLYMSSMGLGSFLTKYFERNLLQRFIQIEILLSLVGGSSIIVIFLLFSAGGLYYFMFVYFLTFLIGLFVGFEIPLVIRIMEKVTHLKENVANVLAYDYIGGLIGSVAFPLILLPGLGIIRTCLLIGFLNLLSAMWLISRTNKLKMKSLYLLVSLLLSASLLIGFINANPLTAYLEQNFYKDQILKSIQTPYQKIVVTKFRDDIRLFLDGNLQFSTIDEYRYHEGLAHIPISLATSHENILILGGGDGLLARELLKHKSVKAITLVDLDKDMTDLFKTDPMLLKINKNSLNSPRLTIENKDAFNYLSNANTYYDLIYVDLPDPRTPELSKLYSTEFYELAKKRLSYSGILVTQSTSPFFAKNAFWCIAKTIMNTFKYSLEYHINVLSFGDWGFVIGSKLPIKDKINNINITVDTKFLTNEEAKAAFVFSKDIQEPKNIKQNSIFEPVLMQYYSKAWSYW